MIDYGEGDAAYKREFATGSVRNGRVTWYGGGVLSGFARIFQGLEWRLRGARVLKRQAYRIARGDA